MCSEPLVMNLDIRVLCTLNIFLDFSYHLLTLNFFSKIITGTLSECQMVCIQIRTDRSVGTEMGPNYLQILSDDKERVGHLGK